MTLEVILFRKKNSRTSPETQSQEKNKTKTKNHCLNF